MKSIVMTLLFVSSSAFASNSLFTGSINAKDSRQAECLAEISGVPYGKAVVDAQGNLTVQFVQDASGKISAEVLADSATIPGRGFKNVTHLYARAKDTAFAASNWEGIVRDQVSVQGDLASTLWIRSEFQHSVGGLNPAANQIIPLTRTDLVVTQDKIFFTRVSLINPADVGLRIPKITLANIKPLQCELDRVN